MVLELSRGLRQLGHDVRVVGLLATNEYPEPRYTDIPRAFLIPPEEYRWPRAIPRMARLLAHEVESASCDAVAIHTPTAALVAAMARLGRPALWVFHGYGDLTRPPSVRMRTRRLADRWAYRRLGRRAVVVDDAMRLAAARHLACAPEAVDVVPNGVDLEAFRFVPSRIVQPPVICMVGTLSRNKRVDHAIRAFALLRHRLPGSRLHVLGDGPERRELQSLIGRLGLESTVQLLGRRDDVAEQLATSSIFWQLSDSEGLPVAILEAMASGLPVVATDVRGIQSVVVDGETGFLVSLDSYDALVARTVELLSDDALRARVGAAGRQRVERVYSAERMFAEYEIRFAKLLA